MYKTKRYEQVVVIHTDIRQKYGNAIRANEIRKKRIVD